MSSWRDAQEKILHSDCIDELQGINHHFTGSQTLLETAYASVLGRVIAWNE